MRPAAQCWLLAWMIGAWPAAVVYADELGLPEVLNSVTRSFPQLRAAELDQVVADAELLSAEGGFDVSWKTKATLQPLGYYESARVDSLLEAPTALWGATAFAGYRLGRGEFAIYDGKAQTLAYGELRAGVTVPIWRNGPIDRRRSSLERAHLGRDFAALGVQAQRVEIARAAAIRYWSWVAAGQRLQVAEEILRIARARDLALSQRVEQGDLPAYELVDNARAIEQRKAQLAAAERALQQTAIDLSLMLRDSEGQPVVPGPDRLPNSLPEPSALAHGLPQDLAFARERRVEMRRFQLLSRSLQVEQAYGENQLAPGIDFQIAGAADLGPKLSTRPDLSYPVLELSLFIDVPLQTRVMRGRTDAAGAQRQRAEVQRGYALDLVTAELRDAHSTIAAASARIDASRNEVALAVRLEEGERALFDQGDTHLLTVNIREQQTAEARLRLVDALLDLQRGKVALQAARGETP
jgi:outer membrane protein, heavy metal efflux system